MPTPSDGQVVDLPESSAGGKIIDLPLPPQDQRKPPMMSLGASFDPSKRSVPGRTMTGREELGYVSKTFPAAMAMTASGVYSGGVLPGLAFVGLMGAAGEGYRQTFNAILGIEPPKKPKEALRGMGEEFVKQASMEAGSRAIVGVGKVLLGPAGSRAENLAVQGLNRNLDLGMTVGEQTGNFPARATQYITDRSFLGGAVASGAKSAKMYEKLAQFTNSTLDRLSSPLPVDQGGKIIQNALEASREAFDQQAAGMYQAVLPQGATVNFKSATDLIQAELKRGSALSKSFPNIMRNHPEAERIITDFVNSGTTGTATFEDAHILRSRLLRIGRESGNRDVAAFADRVSGAVDEDMARAAKANNVLSQWRDVNQFYKEGMQLHQGSVIRGLMSTKPERIVESIGPGDVSKIREIKSALKNDAPTWDVFRRYFIAEKILGNPEVGLKGGEGTLTLGRKMLSRINSLGDGVVKEVFYGARGHEILKNLTDVAVTSSRVRLLNQTGEGPLSVGAFRAIEFLSVGALYRHGIFGPMEVLGGPAIIGSIIHNEAATKTLIAGMKLLDKFPGQGLAQIERAMEIGGNLGKAAKGIETGEAVPSH